jgi:GTPase
MSKCVKKPTILALPNIDDNYDEITIDIVGNVDSGKSTISYNYMVFVKLTPRPRIVFLVDLAGYEIFLKTTITGIISSYPSYGFVLIAKNITHMTREHYSILATMDIPILFILSKNGYCSRKNYDR